ncbi:MAG: 4Fe-4S dicluster domain-containing protein, partial [Nitrososphaerota archaeon]
MKNMDALDELLGDYLNDVLKCVRCGFCNSVCPTSNTSFSYKDSKTSRGRIVLLQAKHYNVLGMTIGSEEFQELMDLCFGCRRCLEVCPAGVRIPQVIWRAKSAGSFKLSKIIFANYGLFEKLGSTFPSLSNS